MGGGGGNKKGSRALVTGGAGFIGSSLVRTVADRFDEVVVIDNLVNGKSENLSGLPSHVQLIVADIRDTGAVAPWMDEHTVVYHLACLGVRHSLHSPLENHEVNATGTLALLQIARHAHVHTFVHVSTSEVYGTAQTVPMTEDHPTIPRTVYGASKLAAETYARAFHETYDLRTIVVRPFNAFGPRCHHEGDSGEVIPRFMLRCMAGKPMVIFGDGSHTRDFSYVEDTAQHIAGLPFQRGAAGSTINLGSGQSIRIDELARLVAEVVGVQPKIVYRDPRPGDVAHLIAGTKSEAGAFRSRVSLQAGLASLRDWYQSLGQSPDELLASEVERNWEPPAKETAA